MNNNLLNSIMMLLAQATPEKCAAVLALLEGRAQLDDTQSKEEVALLTIPEVMALARRSYITVYRAAQSGELRKVQLRGRGSKICFYKKDVQNWIAAGIVQTQNAEGGAA
jgi:excisionase family DNA binding protein